MFDQDKNEFLLLCSEGYDAAKNDQNTGVETNNPYPESSLKNLAWETGYYFYMVASMSEFE